MDDLLSGSSGIASLDPQMKPGNASKKRHLPPPAPIWVFGAAGVLFLDLLEEDDRLYV